VMLVKLNVRKLVYTRLVKSHNFQNVNIYVMLFQKPASAGFFMSKILAMS
jgi:hypothetical protein